MEKEYKLVIDKSAVDSYNAYYFSQHPRAKKPPIERPIAPGLNQLLTLRRLQINAHKQKWKDFGIWLVKQNGLADLKLEKFEIEFHVYMPTRRRADADNHCGGLAKLILDAFTESGFIVDDDYQHLVKITMFCGYDKENSRSEILIKERSDE